MEFLIIDDSPTVRGLLRRLLEGEMPGCRVREAAEGRAAIHELTQGKVDLIITDLQMPGMDGHRLMSVLKGNPLLRRKPVIVLSSSITEELRGLFKDIAHIRFKIRGCLGPGAPSGVPAPPGFSHARSFSFPPS
jgi:CheY-like chemotaxis protein